MERFAVIWCLHGFLGRPSDWDILPFDHAAPDLHAAPSKPMVDWAREFNAGIGDGDVLIGYSLGGRLALHALIDAAECGTPEYGAAIIVSAGLGIAGDAERRDRISRDEAWGQRFLREPWDEVMSAWNAQPLFAGHEAARLERDFDRTRLVEAMRNWSPARHDALEASLDRIQVPILWVAGARDDAYVEVARRAVARLPRGTEWICPDAGHRVPWERPGPFADRVAAFLRDQQCLP